MYGDWNCEVETPFGKENYKISLEENKAVIKHHTGNVLVDDVEYIDNKFFLKKKMDFPITCSVFISGVVDDEKITGSIYVDDYLKVKFIGEYHAINI